MANYSDKRYSRALKNPIIDGTGAVTVPTGTSAERPTPTAGMIRFNTDNTIAEVYDGTGWGGFGAQPPSISSVSPSTFNGESGTLFTINGANFTADASVYFVTSGGTEYISSSVSLVSGSQLTATTPRDFTVAEEPLDVKVVQASGSYTQLDCIDAGGIPVFATASGSIGQIYDSNRGGYSLSPVTATDPDAGGTISNYAIASGSLPSGLSLNSSTGAITGTANAVGSTTTSNFTIRATDNAGNTADRAFSITVNAPIVQSFTSTGSFTFNVPTGVNNVQVLVIAGGAGGGTRNAGGGSGGTDGGSGGGAGGYVEASSFPVTPGGTVSGSVGAGGAGGGLSGSPNPGPGAQSPGSPGGNSTFGPITANGGGYGSAGPGNQPGGPGGSGGGAGGGGGSPGSGGSATQGPSGPGTGYGFPGGPNPNGPPYTGSGGGGAGGAGAVGGNGNQAPGGAGRSSSITGSSVTRAGGGGGGGGFPSPTRGGNGGSGGGGHGGEAPNRVGDGNGGSGGTNTGSGGGGGAGSSWPGGYGGPGGPGIVIVRY